jgi:5'-methylthioadenosine phosphorylase
MSQSATSFGPQVATRQAAVLILGGTAAYGLDLSPYRPLDDPESISTPYGASPPIVFLQPDGAVAPVAFISRHGHDRLQRSAAFLNHRALMWAARELGAQVVFSWNGTGAIAAHLEVGDLVAPHDFLDFTRTRVTTFGHEMMRAATGPAFHPAARSALLAALQRAHAGEKVSPADAIRFHTSGVYVCTEGPRLETTSEIALYAGAGADLVGMTLSPEVFLAQEAGLAYASLCFITNYATGRAAGRPPRRQFGPEVAQTCLPLLMAAARYWVTDAHRRPAAP